MRDSEKGKRLLMRIPKSKRPKRVITKLLRDAEQLECVLAAVRQNEALIEATLIQLQDSGVPDRILSHFENAIRTELNRRRSNRRGAHSNQTDLLVDLGRQTFDLFSSPEGERYASFAKNGQKTTVRLNANAFRARLKQEFHRHTGHYPYREAVRNAVDILASIAEFQGATRRVSVRVGEHEGRIYVDLCDSSGNAIEIDNEGWRVVSEPPVRFYRSPHMAPLPVPAEQGDVKLLRRYLNTEDEAGWICQVAWLVGAIFPSIPHPILIRRGGPGSAKTEGTYALTKVIDPSALRPRTMALDQRSLMIAANHSYILPIDNISRLSRAQSDILCRLATGTALGTRTLHRDTDETIFHAQPPMILNGIGLIATQSDLRDRSIIVHLRRVPKDQVAPVSNLQAEFRADHPKILAGLLNAVSAALRNRETVKTRELPRMADFASIVVAAEPALPWEPGAFLKAFKQNQLAAAENTLWDNPVAEALRSFMEDRDRFDGSPAELYREVTEQGNGEATRQLPGRPDEFMKRLAEISPLLREIGIDFERLPRTGARGRRVALARCDQGVASAAGVTKKNKLAENKPADTKADKIPKNEKNSTDSGAQKEELSIKTASRKRRHIKRRPRVTRTDSWRKNQSA